MTWADNKKEALEERKRQKQQGRCSCIVKNRDGIHWLVSSCPIEQRQLCYPTSEGAKQK